MISWKRKFERKTVSRNECIPSRLLILFSLPPLCFLGLWWFPILKSPSWLKMFQHASYKNAKANSEQFRSWFAEYKPLDGYQGWGA